MNKWICLVAGGVAGTLARYVLAGLVQARTGVGFPYGTLVVNLSGCFFIGLLDALAQKKFLLTPALRVLLMTGFCGAFTTFSTFMLESAQLLRDGEALRAFCNVGASVLAGFVVFWLGEWLGEII